MTALYDINHAQRQSSLGASCSERCVHRLRSVVCKSSVREPKNPKAFKDMDSLRDYLHSKEQKGITIAGALNRLSQASFGTPDSGAERFGLGNIYRALLQLANKSFSRPRSRTPEPEPVDVDARVGQQLSTLMLLSDAAIGRIAAKYPDILTMDPAEIAVRLTRLKALLPSCDISILVEREPRFFLEGDKATINNKVAGAVAVLQAGLHGADVYAMVMQDAGLLGLDVASGVKSFRELWPDADEQALRDSDPAELALAIRALSDVGPPEVY